MVPGGSLSYYNGTNYSILPNSLEVVLLGHTTSEPYLSCECYMSVCWGGEESPHQTVLDLDWKIGVGLVFLSLLRKWGLSGVVGVGVLTRLC